MSKIEEFVSAARARGLEDNETHKKLLAAGWNEAAIKAAMSDLEVPKPDDLEVPQPEKTNAAPTIASAQHPIAVVNNLSVRGFEYSIMFISLIATAFSLGDIILTFIDDHFTTATSDSSDFSSGATSFFVTLLIVVFPIFTFLFLRLKKAELRDPKIQLDPSRRRWLQFTQLAAFLIGIGFTVAFIYQLLNYSSNDQPNLAHRLLQTLVVLAISGGIFGYYWHDEHKTQ